MEPKTYWMIIGTLSTLLIIAGIFGIGYYNQAYKLIEENNEFREESLIFRTLIYADGALSLNSAEDGSDALSYYDEASLAYEKQEWDDVVENCENARDSWVKEGHQVKLIKAKIDAIETDNELISIYILICWQKVQRS